MTIDLGIKTAGREVGDKAKGCGMQLFAAVLLLAGFGSMVLMANQEVFEGWYIIPSMVLLGAVVLGILGLQEQAKAQHVAWTREAIERSAPTATSQPTTPRSERECPYCAELILRKARVCKHCGSEVDPLNS